MAATPMTEEVRRHNETLLAQLEPGDLIEFPREMYSHWAVYIGNRQVVHLPGDDLCAVSVQSAASRSTTSDRASVELENFWNVVEGCKAKKNNSKDEKYRPLPNKKIVQRAKQKIGHGRYDPVFENCEHFATWCRYNKSESEQVNTLLRALGVVVAIGASAVLWAIFKVTQ